MPNIHLAGIHSGEVIAAVVGGKKRPRYCMFGETAKIAKCMETTGEVCTLFRVVEYLWLFIFLVLYSITADARHVNTPKVLR